MGRYEYEPATYLTKRGRKIFHEIVDHVRSHDLIFDIDVLELSMLANCYAIYEEMSDKCKDGYIVRVTGKNGTFDQVKPEYNIMQQQYANILKHSSKFGLTPGDREKIFNGLKKKKPVSITDDLD